MRFLLQIPADAEVRFDRFSDSAGTYVTLDSNNPAIYKQLYRAAKAKLKLRLKATVIEAKKPEDTPAIEEKTPVELNKRNTYLDTVLLNQPTDACAFQPLQPTVVQSTIDKPMSERSGMTRELSRPTLPAINDFGSTTFTIDCNRCGQSVKDEHYHCGKCENGDFDLCSTCIEKGITCDDDDHWLIKRTLKDGKITASNTETLAPKSKTQPAASENTPVVEEDQRTCNSCIIRRFYPRVPRCLMTNLWQNSVLRVSSHASNVPISIYASSASSTANMVIILRTPLLPLICTQALALLTSRLSVSKAEA